MWRIAGPTDDEAILSMCLSLYSEDPSPEPIVPEQILRTLQTLRSEPFRGRALVLEVDGGVVGFALLISFWSNEFGGELCHIDELYVAPQARGSGHGTTFFDQLIQQRQLWPGNPAAFALEVTPANTRARSLYERLGFQGKNLWMKRRSSRGPL